MVTLSQHSNSISTGQSSGSDPGLSRAGHTAVAVFLGFILVLGFLCNLMALLVFSRFHWLRTPVNLLLINISASDMLVCIFGTPLSLAASVHGRWLTGSYGCRWYGFSNALFGEWSCGSTAYYQSTLISGGDQSMSSPFIILGSIHQIAKTKNKASWLYSLVWTLPPLLGWSSYGPEGHGTTCSVQWHQRSATSRSYVSCLFIFCLLLPLMLMLFCYGRILLAVREVARQVTDINRSSAEQREGRILLMVVFMVTGYLLCWMPYGVVAMLSSFGRPGMLPSTASLIPALLAKASTVLNPFIYVLLNKQFSRCFLHMIRCSSEAPPTPGHLTRPSNEGAWPHPRNLPTEELNSPKHNPTFTPSVLP
nr:PREDICTED: rhodopsin-like [Paralichthys olivaceus]